MFAFIHANWAVIASVLWGLSEILAAIPSIESSSVFQLIFNVVKQLVAPKDPPKV